MTTLALRPLSTGEILDGSPTVLRRHFGRLFGVTVICQAVPTALDAYVEVAGGLEQYRGLALLSRLLDFFGCLLVSGGTVGVVSEVYLGRQPRLGDALRLALDKMGVVFGAGFLAGIVTGLATLARVIPGIIVFGGQGAGPLLGADERLQSEGPRPVGRLRRPPRGGFHRGRRGHRGCGASAQ